MNDLSRETPAIALEDRTLWSPLPVTRPRTTLVSFFIATLVLAGIATQFQINQGLEFFLLKDDPERIRNQEIKSEFSNDELIVLGLDLGHEISADDLAAIDDLTTELERIEGVESVVSITNADDILPDGDFLDTSSVFDRSELERDPEVTTARVRKRAVEHRLVERALISQDLEAVAIVLEPQLVNNHTSALVNQGIVHALEGMIDDLPYDAYLGGYPPAEVDSTRIATRDLVVLTGSAFLLILVLIVVVFRHWLPAVMMIALATWTQITAVAFLVLIQAPFTTVTATLPTILLATSSAYAIYAFSLLRGSSQEQIDTAPGRALLTSLRRPCTVSAISTGAGFLALVTTPILAIQHLGLGLAVGILACLLGALCLLPALAQLFSGGLESRQVQTTLEPGHWATKGIDFSKRPAIVLALVAAVLAVAAFGIARIKVESDPITYWRSDSYHRISDDFLQEHFDGALFVNVVLSTGEPEGALRPEVLRYAQRLIDASYNSGIVTDSLSLIDYLAMIDDAIVPESAHQAIADRKFLDSESLASQYMLLYENSGQPEDFEDFVNFDRSGLNIYLKVNSRSSLRILDLRDRIYAAAQDIENKAPQGVTTEVLGTWLMFPKAMDGVSRYMIKGLLFAILAILLLMTITLRSLKLGLVSVLPNVLPIVVCLGLMGWLGVPLSFVTSITGCLALGLAVDDTAHVLGHLGFGGASEAQGLRTTYARVSRALLLTTICVGGGFLTLCLSEFLPIVHMGFAAALTLLVAFICDLYVLPTLLVLVGVPVESAASPH